MFARALASHSTSGSLVRTGSVSSAAAAGSSSASSKHGRPMRFPQLASRRARAENARLGSHSEGDAMAKAKRPIPEGYHTVTPTLTFTNAAQAIDWYRKALGAEEIGGRAGGPGGKNMHAGPRLRGPPGLVVGCALGGEDPEGVRGVAGAVLVFRG